MISQLEAQKQTLIADLKALNGKDDRLRYIIKQGQDMTVMEARFKLDQFLVKGCISRAWLFPAFKNGHVMFHADSEAMIVKGIIAILLKVYNGCRPEEILTEDGQFLGKLGITEHLSMNRRNGLANVLKLIHQYAAAFATQQAALNEKGS